MFTGPSTPPTAAPQTTTSPRTAPLLALRSALGASPELADGQHLFLELEYLMESIGILEYSFSRKIFGISMVNTVFRIETLMVLSLIYENIVTLIKIK
jgi:hypothetical protein